MILVNIYVPNIGAPKYIRQIFMDIKGEINSNTVIVKQTLTFHRHQWVDPPDRKSIWKQQS